MDAPGIESALAAAEERLARGEGIGGTGFRQAVARAKRTPELAERYGPRIAAIDDAAFRRWAMLVVPLVPGTVLAVLATVGGLFLIGWSYALEEFAAVAAFWVGLGVLLVTTHGLSHLMVGRLLGIRFTSWFVGSLKRPQPGVKLDFDSYLRSSPQRRAWTHAAGAIVTKLVPFALIGAARAAELPEWVVWALIGLGVATILTDFLWSTKSSDWSRFRREMQQA